MTNGAEIMKKLILGESSEVELRKEKAIEELRTSVDKIVELLDVVEYINNLQYEDTKVKITIQQQDFRNSTNTSYEKIILK